MRQDGDGSLAVQLGWSRIKGLSETAAERLVCARQSGPFRSYADFVQRTSFTPSVLSRLARADAFGSLGLGRRPALWQSLEPLSTGPLLASVPQEDPPLLPLLSPAEEVIHDYRAQGLSLRGHPMAPLRTHLERQNVVKIESLASLKAEQRYRIAGLVLLRQRPGTAKGVTFMTLEDETGTANLIVWKNVWDRFRRVAHQVSCALGHGAAPKAGRRDPSRG